MTVTGRIVKRSADTINPNLPTGEVELVIAALEVQSAAELLPFPVNSEAETPEDMRLTYRFLDLRRERMHANIMLRDAGHRLDPAADGRAGLHRVPDADPDRRLAGGGAAAITCRAGCIRASSTRCRRRRSNSSNC